MPIQMTEEKVMERIRLLLNKAERTDNEHEAQAFSDQADRLMAQFEIDSAAVEAGRLGQEGVPAEPIVTHKIEWTDGYALIEARFHAWIAQAFGLRTVVHSRRVYKGYRKMVDPSYRSLSIVGHKGDVERAVAIITSLRIQATSALAHRERTDYDFILATGAQRRSMRGSYLMMFASTAADRIKANRRTVHATVAKGTGTDLVLVDRSKAVDRYVEDQFGKLGKGRPATINEVAAAAGRKDGRNANTGESALAGRRALEG